jgi:chemotaxis protein histidine kinase CheA
MAHRQISHDGWSTRNPNQEKLALFEAAFSHLNDNAFTEQCRDNKNCCRLTCFFLHDDEEREFQDWCEKVKGFEACVPPQHRLHKTVECKRFVQNGECPYRDRCAFIHPAAEAAAATTAAAPEPAPAAVAASTAAAAAVPRITDDSYPLLCKPTQSLDNQSPAAAAAPTAAASVSTAAAEPAEAEPAAETGATAAAEAVEGDYEFCMIQKLLDDIVNDGGEIVTENAHLICSNEDLWKGVQERDKEIKEMEQIILHQEQLIQQMQLREQQMQVREQQLLLLLPLQPLVVNPQKSLYQLNGIGFWDNR